MKKTGCFVYRCIYKYFFFQYICYLLFDFDEINLERKVFLTYFLFIASIICTMNKNNL